MSPYLTLLKAVLDTLLALLAVVMSAIDAPPCDPPVHRPTTMATESAVRVSFTPAQEVSALIEQLRSPEPASRVAAACELQRLGSEARIAIPALVERLADASPVEPKVCGEDRHYWRREIDEATTPGHEAAAALVAIGTASLHPLAAAARGPLWIARRNAVWALGALDDGRGVPSALAALQDSEPRVRETAAWALGALDADEAVAALIGTLADADAGVRAQAAWALGAIRDRRAVDGLIVALKDAEERVRAQAAWALGALGDRRAASALASALKDASPRVRRQAAWALGTIAR